MRIHIMLLLVLAPVVSFGQYIGNPTGKAIPLSIMKNRPFELEKGFIGFDIGFTSRRLDADYNVTTGTGSLRKISRLNQTYAAISGGGNIHGFELEGKIGGLGQEINEDYFDHDPLQDAGGVLVGASARWGFSPVEHLRLGLGGQFTYSWSRGDTYVSDGMTSWKEDINFELLTSQIFTGAGLDFRLNKEIVFSPYLGAGFEFIDGKLVYKDWDCCCCSWDDKLADFDEDNPGFVFGGFDFHFNNKYRAGLECNLTDSGASAVISLGAEF